MAEPLRRGPSSPLEATRIEIHDRDMPVTVAVDSTGASIHQTGPSQWRRPVVTRSPAPVPAI